MKLLNYWPSDERINECIPAEAEALSDAVFLAVHQAPRLFRRFMSAESETKQAREAELLDWLLSPDVPEGHRVVPIVGHAGTGKSHLIRWLDIHIDRAGRHVIRIPKSTSLRGVLDLILRKLEGPAYDAIRLDLSRARDNLSNIALEESLLANFRTVLRERIAERDQKVRQANQIGRPLDPIDVKFIESANDILRILQGKTWEALREGPVCQALLRGVLQGHAIPSDARTQFEPDDFRFPTVRPDQVAADAKVFLGRLKVATKDRDRDAVSSVLNEIRDAALYPLMGLGPGRLSELFREVRKALLAEGRELVLLVEDFANLAGIQKALLDVVIEPGVREGKQLLCTMRTALAVTDGYLSPWDTVRTRTRDTEWVIRETPTGDDEQTVEMIVNLAGAYLNAARLGQTALVRARQKAANPTTSDWVPVFDETNGMTESERRQLAAFGTSAQDYALFPFNRAAIEQIARRVPELRTQEGLLRLNPRRVINNVLREHLRNQRLAFEERRFPPPGFAGFRASDIGPDVQTLLASRSPDDLERTAALLWFWGGRPQTAADVRLPKEIYAAFGVSPVTGHAGIAGEDAPPPPKIKSPDPTRPVPPIARPEAPSEAPPLQFPAEVTQRTAVLRKWRGEGTITQPDANWFRNALVKAVDAFIDWDAELLEPVSLTQTYYTGFVYLPNARGGAPTCTASNALMSLCDDATFSDANSGLNVELDLRAVVRYHELEHFDYEDGFTDQARYANLVQRLAAQAVAFVRARYERLALAGDPVPMVAQALLVSARLLDLPRSHGSGETDALEAIFSSSPDPQHLSQDDTKWARLLRSVTAERRRALQFLLRRVGGRQGSGEKIHAVDATRLLAAVGGTRKSWKVELSWAEAELAEDARLVRSFVLSMRPEIVDAAVAERRQRLKQWVATTIQWLGTEFDKPTVIEVLRETVNKAVAADVFRESGESTADRVRNSISEFQKARVSETLNEINRLSDDAAPGSVLSILSHADDKVLTIVDRLREGYDHFLDRTIAAVQSRLKTMGVDPDATPNANGEVNDLAKKSAEEIDKQLEAIAVFLEGLSEGKELGE